jgi:uncharacterized delta-60 repeat protein
MNLKPFRILLGLFALAPAMIGGAGLAANGPGADLTANPALQAHQPDALLAAHPGDLDSTFGEEGKEISPFTIQQNYDYGAVLQPDGKLVVASYSWMEGSSSQAGVFLARFNFEGSPDLSFGSGGQVRTYFPGMSVAAFTLAIQMDGKLLAAGNRTNPQVPDPYFADFALVRYLKDGLPDGSFGENGLVTLDFGASEIVERLAILGDGRILAVGRSGFGGYTGSIVAARFHPDGSIDPTFGSQGKAEIVFGALPYVSLLQPFPDGSLLIGGDFASKTGLHGLYLLRLLADGSRDASFGQDGQAMLWDHDRETVFKTMTALPGRKYLAIGAKFVTPLLLLKRINPDGSADPTFGDEGTVTDPSPGLSPADGCVWIQPDGKILIGGITSNDLGSDFAVRRYLPDGSRDPGFGQAGMVTVNLLPQDRAEQLLSDSAGRLWVAGRTLRYDPQYTFLALVRLWYAPPVNAFTTWFPVVGK